MPASTVVIGMVLYCQVLQLEVDQNLAPLWRTRSNALRCVVGGY